MGNAIRFGILGDAGLSPVIGEEFEIDGTKEQFAVHPSTYRERVELDFLWCATHVETGLRIAKGNDIDEVIELARVAWKDKTPEQIESALVNGRAMRRQAFLQNLDISDLCND
jgi:hypothetical protein